MNEVKFSGYLTFEDDSVLTKKIKDQKTFSVSGVTTILTLAVITLMVMEINMGIVETSLMLGFWALFIGGLFYWLYKSNQKRLKKHYSEVTHQPRTGLLKNEEILIQTNKISTKLKLDLFDKVIEEENIIALVQKKEFYIGFSEYMFQSNNDWLKAREIIRNAL